MSGYVPCACRDCFETAITRFDRCGPCGHTELVTYLDAIKLAAIDFGVDLDRVVFA